MKQLVAFIVLAHFCFSQDVVFNKNVNVKEIKSLFVDIEPNNNIPNPYDNENYVKSWTSVYEEILLRDGFNVISRDKINAIINDEKLSMAGPARNESIYKAGKLAGSSGVLFVRAAFSDDSTYREEVRLVSIKSGKIYFTGAFVSNRGESRSDSKHKRENIILYLKRDKD